MKLVSIEPTPSPNSMKLNLDEALPKGVRNNYTPAGKDDAPPEIRELLSIPGVTGVYHAEDFIALDRHPKGDWQQILTAARAILGEAGEGAAPQGVPGEKRAEAAGGPAGAAGAADTAGAAGAAGAADTAGAAGAAGFGEVRVAVQMFRGIPMQIRVYADDKQDRTALPERFSKAAMQAGVASPNLIMERRLEEHGVRYGTLQEVLEEVAREIDAAYDQQRLNDLVEKAAALAPGESPEEEQATPEEFRAAWKDPDWRKRYAVLERLKPTPELLPVLEEALDDPQVSIRRLAAVYLGDLKIPEALPPLFRALKDRSPIVRRTAGDTLSDIGDPAAAGPMAEALRDPNKLVRWRAARFLYEAGDESAIPALSAALDEPEFEVRMQVQMALERIEGGQEAAGSVWQQMTNRARD